MRFVLLALSSAGLLTVLIYPSSGGNIHVRCVVCDGVMCGIRSHSRPLLPLLRREQRAV